MGFKRTYVLSVHEQEGNLVLEEVRTRRRARLADVSEIGEQIDRWREQDLVVESSVPEGGPGTVTDSAASA